MPEDLTDLQRTELVNDLTALREELARSLETNVESVQPVDLGQPIGRVSRIDAIQQQKMAQANRSASQRRLAHTTRAIAAARHDGYGYCRRCEEPIGYARLKARPETPFCLECQQQTERQRR